MKITALQLAENLTDYINTYNTKEKTDEFVKAFCRQHNTLQQSSFRMILGLIEHMATEQYHTDGRNEQSKKLAQKLLNGFKSEYRKELLSQGVSEQRVDSYIGDDIKPSNFLSFI